MIKFLKKYKNTSLAIGALAVAVVSGMGGAFIHKKYTYDWQDSAKFFAGLWKQCHHQWGQCHHQIGNYANRKNKSGNGGDSNTLDNLNIDQVGAGDTNNPSDQVLQGRSNKQNCELE